MTRDEAQMRATAARIALGWIAAWQVDPDQLTLVFRHLARLEERVPRGTAESGDLREFETPVVAVCAAIIALCDASGVVRFDSYEAIRSSAN